MINKVSHFIKFSAILCSFLFVSSAFGIINEAPCNFKEKTALRKGPPWNFSKGTSLSKGPSWSFVKGSCLDKGPRFDDGI